MATLASGKSFSVIHEKLMHCRLVCMCPTMDLVASLQADGQLSVHRTMGWQRSFTLTPEDMGNRTFSCITWSPNGKTLAVGFADGTILLFGVEAGAEESSLQFHEGRPLAALAWVAQQPRQGAAVSRTDEEVDHLAEVGAAYADRCEHILGPSDRLPGGNGGSSGGVGGRSSSDYGSQGDDGFALLEGMRERPVSVLASADASGVVILSICGAYRLITIDLRAHRSSGDPKGKERSPAAGGRSATPNADSPSKGRSRKSHSPGSGTKAGAGAAKETSGDISGKALRPLQLTLSADLSLLSALVEVDGYIELIQVDLPLLWSRRHELKPLAMQFTAFRALIGRLVAYVPRLPQLWNSSLQTLENKLGAFESTLTMFNYDKGITPRDELLHLVTCGFASDALTQFLSTGLTEVQITRMRKAVDTGTGQVEAMLRGDLSFLARTLLFRASDLHRSALVCKTKTTVKDDGDLGLGAAPVETFLKDCGILCVKVEQALREVQVCRSRLRFLLTWLEQMSPIVTESSNPVNPNEPRDPPSLSLARSVLSMLREPLPSDGPALGTTPILENTRSRSRVESIIGASVPALLADDITGEIPNPFGTSRNAAAAAIPKGASAILAEEPALWAHTVRGQVQRLQASVAEVFKAPRNRLSRAVRKPTCAKMCASSEGCAADLVKTRAAARAAAAATVGAPPLVPMRACICFQENLPAGCSDINQGEWGIYGGIVTAAVAPDNSRTGKEVDVVWVVVTPTVRGRPASCTLSSEYEGGMVDAIFPPVQVAGVKSPCGYHVRQVAFYASVPGVVTQNEARLAVVIEPVGHKDQASILHLLALDELSFSTVASLADFDEENPLKKTTSGVAKGIVAEARSKGIETTPLSELNSRSRTLPEHVKGVTIALSGARGIACAVSTSKHMLVFDLEEDEDDEEEEEEEEE